MKTINAFLAGLVAAALSLAISCNTSSVLSSAAAKPTLNFDKVSIKSLDAEGITFNCNYSVKNPYPIGISLSKVAADVSCNSSKLTSISANEGVSISANKSKSNAFDFKIPYDSIISFAKTYKESKTLPFTVKGNVALGNLPLISSLNLPFTKNFDVPVFKPNLKISNPKLVLPSVSEITKSLTDGGMSLSKAGSLAKSIVTGQKIDESVLSGVNLNMKLNFNLDVANDGGSDWKYALKSCGIKADGVSDILSLDTSSASEIGSSGGSIPLSATLNTMTAGKFIAQLLNKSGNNPTFSLDSALSFPSLPSYASNLPLTCTKELSLSKIAR